MNFFDRFILGWEKSNLGFFHVFQMGKTEITFSLTQYYSYLYKSC